MPPHLLALSRRCGNRGVARSLQKLTQYKAIDPTLEDRFLHGMGPEDGECFRTGLFVADMYAAIIETVR